MKYRVFWMLIDIGVVHADKDENELIPFIEDVQKVPGVKYLGWEPI